MECPVCYSDCARGCKLVCGHSFCYQCVKDWYQKAEAEPTCPMCRASLYFRNMRTHLEKWEDEREEKHLEGIFNEAFDEIFEDMEEVLEMFGSMCLTWRIEMLQERFNMIVEAGYDPEDIIYDEEFELFTDTIHSCGDPTKDPLMFVSKNKRTKRRGAAARTGKRNLGHADRSNCVDFFVVVL